MTQTLSCQDKTIKNENHFQIKGKDIFYNNQKVYLGMPIEKFTKIVNSEFRIAKDVFKGRIEKGWSWKDGGEAYVNDNGKIEYLILTSMMIL